MGIYNNMIFDELILLTPAHILKYMWIMRDRELYYQKLQCIIDCTYSHLRKIINMLIILEFVKVEKRGKKNIITLTNKGGGIGRMFVNMSEIL
ncbi:MAG: hypothetical protein AABY22_09935 [Nanoarchaeota archaeon]